MIKMTPENRIALRQAEQAAHEILSVFDGLEGRVIGVGNFTISPLLTRRNAGGVAFWVASLGRDGLQSGHIFLWPEEKERLQMRVLEEFFVQAFSDEEYQDVTGLLIPRRNGQRTASSS